MKRKQKRKIFLILVLFFSFLFLVCIFPLILNFGKTGKNIQLLNKNYSYLNKKEIISRLDSDFPLDKKLILKNENREFILNLSSVSAEINKSQTASNLLFRRLNKGILKYFRDFFHPQNFTLEIKYNNDFLDQNINSIASQIDKPFIPSEIILNNDKSLSFKKGELGEKTDINALKNQILNSLNFYQISSPLEIPVNVLGSLPSDDQIKKTENTANTIKGKSIILTSADQNIVLDDKTLISWLGFDSLYRLEQIDAYVDSLKDSLKHDPVDASFKFENNKVLDFQLAKSGYYLDADNLKNLLHRRFSDLLASTENKLNIDLPLVFIEPKIKNSDVNNLGIKELLGKGVSTFKHSNATRNFNVEKGASIINRILVAPNETFSFVQNLGDVTLDTGFKKAYIIREGKTELDVGGGICQVSTTLFRAMLNAGLNIIERQPHAYRVGYYEEDSPPGFDATVFVPKPDLKFVNDTGHYVLIQNNYDGINKVLTYEIYGTSDGRKTEISNYRKWDSTPPPPDKYIDDPTLKPGQVVQDEHAIAGLKTAFDWKVTDKNGQIIHQKTYQSVYVPWGAVYRRGI
jgi:vancomycin resistance protein YoaR